MIYCNGTGHFNGSLRVSVLTSDGDVNADGCNADTFNSHITTNDIVFKHNDVEYMRFNATDDEIQLSRNIDVGSSTLICNNFDSGLSDVVFNLGSNEFLRFQLSDNTVRVPNTKSFLSQNVFTDIVKPLAFGNDVSFQGQNDTDDGYEEYFKIKSNTKNIDFSKGISSIKCNEFNSNGDTDVVLKQNNIEFIRLKTNGNMEIKRLCSFISTLALDASGALSIFRNPANSLETIDIKNNYGNGRHRFIIANNTIFEMTTSLIKATRILECDAGIKTNTINTDGDVNLSLQRNGSDYITFNTNKIELSKSLHLANELVIDAADKLTMRPSLEGGINIFDIRNLHPVVDNPMIRFRVGEGGGDTIVCEMRNEYLSMSRNVIIGAGYELQTNIIDTNGDNDLVFQRNNIQFLALDKFTEDTVEKEAIICSKQLRANGNILVNKLQINQFPIGIEYCDFRLHDADSVMRFYVGNSTSVNLQMTNSEITLGRVANCNGGLITNTVNSNGNNDMVFQIDGTEILKFRASDSLILGSDASTCSSPKVYSNEFLNRTLSYDTVFYGANATSDGRVEYMKWNRSAQQLDFNAPIAHDCIFEQHSRRCRLCAPCYGSRASFQKGLCGFLMKFGN